MKEIGRVLSYDPVTGTAQIELDGGLAAVVRAFSAQLSENSWRTQPTPEAEAHLTITALDQHRPELIYYPICGGDGGRGRQLSMTTARLGKSETVTARLGCQIQQMIDACAEPVVATTDEKLTVHSNQVVNFSREPLVEPLTRAKDNLYTELQREGLLDQPMTTQQQPYSMVQRMLDACPEACKPLGLSEDEARRQIAAFLEPIKANRGLYADGIHRDPAPSCEYTALSTEIDNYIQRVAESLGITPEMLTGPEPGTPRAEAAAHVFKQAYSGGAQGASYAEHEWFRETGARGPTGAEGPCGPVGAPGPTGPTGPTGSLGPVGSLGAIGAAGIKGPCSPLDPDGPRGPHVIRNDDNLTPGYGHIYLGQPGEKAWLSWRLDSGASISAHTEVSTDGCYHRLTFDQSVQDVNAVEHPLTHEYGIEVQFATGKVLFHNPDTYSRWVVEGHQTLRLSCKVVA